MVCIRRDVDAHRAALGARLEPRRTGRQHILERDADALVAAAKSLSELSRPLLHAAAAEDAGTELARINRTPESLDELNVAFETYLRCGATADAQRVGQVLRTHGISRRVVGKPRPQRGIDSLTDSELKVAHLVAAGATNRAVAQRLFLSPHTVNSHLRNAFAKLGIRSRTELSRFISAHHEPVVDEPWPN